MTITASDEENGNCMIATGFTCDVYFARIMGNLTEEAAAVRKRSAAEKLEKLPPEVRDTIIATIDDELVKAGGK